jgi:hypothetical protein
VKTFNLPIDILDKEEEVCDQANSAPSSVRHEDLFLWLNDTYLWRQARMLACLPVSVLATVFEYTRCDGNLEPSMAEHTYGGDGARLSGARQAYGTVLL